MGESAIEWTDRSWNPLAGCQIVSEACSHCYAMGEAHRLATKLDQAKYQGLTKVTPVGQVLWTGEVRFWEPAMAQVTARQRPAIIFVNSMSDPFHEGVALSDLERIFARMAEASQHTFQVLTKRPERMLALADKLPWTPNILMGVTCEGSAYTGRVDLLRRHPYLTPETRFISAEPLVDDLAPALGLSEIGWLIVGGETGKDRTRIRRMMPEWARGLRDLAVASGTRFFFKQWGCWSPEGVWRAKPPKGEKLDGVLWHQMPWDGPEEGRAA